MSASIMHITKEKQELIRKRFKRAIRKHSVLLLTQVAFSSMITFGWYELIWLNGIRIDREDMEYFLAGVIFLASASWVLKGAEVLRVVWDQYRMMVSAVKRADVATIIELKDENIPLLMHFYLTVLAMITAGVMMIMPFKHMWSGAAAVFLVTLIFTFFAAIILELEDPLENGWIRAQIIEHDPHVLSQDSEEFFAERWKRRKAHGRRDAA